MVQKHYPAGLDDRQRDRHGEIRKKRSDTLAKAQQDEYGPDFAKKYRSDAQLSALLEREESDGLHHLRNRKPK